MTKTEKFAYLCNDLMKYQDKLEDAEKELKKTHNYFDALNVKNLKTIIESIKFTISGLYEVAKW